VVQAAPASDFKPGGDRLVPAFLDGQVANGGRMGMLGQQNAMDVPFNIISYTAKLVEDQQARTVGDVVSNDAGVQPLQGLAKSEVMAERIRQINPECRVTVIDDFVTADNVAQYMGVGYSYVIDAIDSVRPKAALIAYCRRYKVPLVTTGGAGGQIDPTQIQVSDLAKTIQDPLAAKLRERLKSDFNVVKNSKGKLGVDCVFSTEALVYPQADGSVCAMKSTAEGPKRMDCASGFGAATMVTASFGFVAVSHALKKMMAKASRQA
jgi:tRNA A37 threonylcarbamoyladenosine dehydratase